MFFWNKTTQAGDSASVWVAVHEGMSWSPPASDFFLHFMSLTSPQHAALSVCVVCCGFHSSWASCACASLCLWNPLPARWDALRMSTAAAFPARVSLWRVAGSWLFIAAISTGKQMTMFWAVCCLLFFSACPGISGCALCSLWREVEASESWSFAGSLCSVNVALLVSERLSYSKSYLGLWRR